LWGTHLGAKFHPKTSKNLDGKKIGKLWIWGSQKPPKIGQNLYFFMISYRLRFQRDFGVIFGGSEPEKQ
jgi:hypothetical protein